MKQYLDMINHILQHGNTRPDRTGTGTRGVFGYQTRFDLSGWKLPAVTVKKTHLDSMVHELIWLISGDTNVKYLTDNNVSIWNEWANIDGDLGPIYGKQWRNFGGDFDASFGGTGGRIDDSGVDQLHEIIAQLRDNPFSRRHVVSAWNPKELPDERMSPQANVVVGRMALAPCHALFQFYVEIATIDKFVEELRRYDPARYSNAPEDERDSLYDGWSDITAKIRKGEDVDLDMVSFGSYFDQYIDDLNVPVTIIYALSLQLYQRSADVGLGVPFNIASYALLTMMVAKSLGYQPKEFIWTGGDVHIYSNHNDLLECLNRAPLRSPTVTLADKESIFEFTASDIVINDYKYHSKINLPVAV